MEDEGESRDELNVQSEKFDALQALYSKNAVVPFPAAPVLDNVARASSLLSKNERLVNKPPASAKAKKEVAPSTSSADDAASVEEVADMGHYQKTRPLTQPRPSKTVSSTPDTHMTYPAFPRPRPPAPTTREPSRHPATPQCLVLDSLDIQSTIVEDSGNGTTFPSREKTKQEVPMTREHSRKMLSTSLPGRKRRGRKNVFTQMERTRGPLAFLKACMEKRIRVKVWTRSARSIRGYCLGFVVAFDKYWNVVLEDVREVWSRPAKRKKFLLGDANEMPLSWRAMGPAVRPPKVVVTGVEGGRETCERHVSQMVVRGEQIAFVSVPNT